MYFALNGYWEALEFELPEAPPGSAWRRGLDTSLPSPDDIQPLETSPMVTERSYTVSPRSVIAFVAPVSPQ